MKKKCLIGLVGKACSGKDTVAHYLVEKHGFLHVSTGDFIRSYVLEHALGEPTRDVLRQVGNKLRAQYGPDYFVRLAMQQATPFTVVSGIRAVAEAEALLEQGTILLVEAPIMLRYNRTVQRGRESDHISFETFVAQEKAEDNNPDPAAQNIMACMKLATHKLSNTGDLDILKGQIDMAMRVLLG